MLGHRRRARLGIANRAIPCAPDGGSRSEAGMSLIELIIAISLLAIIMVGLSASIGVAYKSVSLGRQRQVAESAANKRLEELRDVDYTQMAMSTSPTKSSDVTNPDYWVSEDGARYDVTGEGDLETLVVDSITPGPVQHIESPVVIGTTKVDVYQFVTWVDAPDVPGTQNLKRITVVVKYRNIAVQGSARVLRQSVTFTSGTVTVSGTATTTTTSTTIPPTTTTLPAITGCGQFSVASGTSASANYTSSRTVTLSQSMSACNASVWTQFSNDGGDTWGAETAWDSENPALGWTLGAGDGTKQISGRARAATGSSWSIGTATIILDTTKPATPGTVSKSVTCSGTNRTALLTWSASSDSNLVGYRIYRSTDGVAWAVVSSTTGLTGSDTHAKSLTSVRFYVGAYDKAGNQSLASNILTLSKNQCT